MPHNPPSSEEDARLAVRVSLHEEAAWIARFSTGNRHYVYDVVTASGRRCVVRLTAPEDVAHFRGALYWSERLRPLGVPLPAILAHNLERSDNSPFPFLILERLPGRDLGQIYAELAPEDKKRLALEMADIHGKLNGLPQGTGYGYAFSYDAFPHASWHDVVRASLERSRKRIEEGGIFNPTTIDSLEVWGEALREYFQYVPPAPFLHDTTTKNVIVENGHLSGIVDVDDLCFGDRLLVLALTRMALLARGGDTLYVDEWIGQYSLDGLQRKALSYYTAQCCADFMGEVGQDFNGNRVPMDGAYCTRLETILEESLARS